MSSMFGELVYGQLICIYLRLVKLSGVISFFYRISSTAVSYSLSL